MQTVGRRLCSIRESVTKTLVMECELKKDDRGETVVKTGSWDFESFEQDLNSKHGKDVLRKDSRFVRMVAGRNEKGYNNDDDKALCKQLDKEYGFYEPFITLGFIKGCKVKEVDRGHLFSLVSKVGIDGDLSFMSIIFKEDNFTPEEDSELRAQATRWIVI